MKTKILCFVDNGEKSQRLVVTLTFHQSMHNGQLFQPTFVYCKFKSFKPLFLRVTVTHTHTHTFV